MTRLLAAALFSAALSLLGSAPAMAQAGVPTIGTNGCHVTATSKGTGATLTIDYNTGDLCGNILAAITAAVGSFVDGAITTLGLEADAAWTSGSGTLIAISKAIAGAQATTNTNLGPPGATACATDTGSCSLNALLQRLAQRLTTLNTTLGTPAQAGGTVTVAGNSGAVTQTNVSVTNASTALLTAAQFTNFEKICVALTASTGVWVNWANAAAVTAAPSEYIPPGQCDTWIKSTGFMPTAAAFAISNSASTIAVTIEGN